MAAKSSVSAGVEGADGCVGYAGFEFPKLGGVQPFGGEAGAGGLERVVGGFHFGDVGVVEGDADGGYDGGIEVHAGAFGQVGPYPFVHIERADGERGKGAGYAGAFEGVQSSGGVCGGVGGDAVAFDDGGFDSGQGQVVGDGASGGSGSDYYDVVGVVHFGRLLCLVGESLTHRGWSWGFWFGI